MIIDVLQSIKLICNFRTQSIINQISKLNSQAWVKLKVIKNSSKKISSRNKDPTIPPTMCSSTIHQKPSFSQAFSDSSLRTSMKWISEGSRLSSTERLSLSFIMANCLMSLEIKRINKFNNVSWKKSSSSLPGTTQSSSLTMRKKIKNYNSTSKRPTTRKNTKLNSSLKKNSNSTSTATSSTHPLKSSTASSKLPSSLSHWNTPC